MRNNLLQIYAKGFMGFFDQLSISFIEEEGKTFQIDGKNKDDKKSKSNGAGKSSFLELINWGWYGELCRKNRYKDEVIHKQAQEVFVQTLFDNDNREIKTYRTLGRKKGMDLKIWIDGDEQLKGSTYQIKQNFLEKIIGMDFISYQCMVMFGRDFMNFPDLKPGDRAQVLSDIRGLEKYTGASKKASDLAKSVKTNVSNLTLDLERETGNLTGVRSANYAPQLAAWNIDRQELIKDMEESLNILKIKISNRSTELGAERDNFQNQIKMINIILDGLQKELPNKDVIITSMEQMQNTLAEYLAKDKYLCNLILNITNEMNRMISKGEGPCPFCSQTISGEYLNQRVNQLGLEKMEHQTRLGETRILQSKTNVLYQENKKSMDFVTKKESEIKVQNEKVHNLEKQILNLQGDEKLANYKAELISRQGTLEIKKTEVNPYIKLEEERKEKIKQIGIKIRSIKSEITNLENTQAYYDSWTEGFKKIRMMLFDTMISSLEDITQQILSKYSDELSIIMSTERETRSGTIKDEFNITVVDANGFPMSWEMYSGGEKQKGRLSIARALAQFIKDKCGRDFNFIAFDEPNDSLDDLGKETNFEIFQELADEGKIVLVTDHDANFKDKFNYTILVTKEGGKSTVSYV